MLFFSLWVNCATYFMFISLHICSNIYFIVKRFKNTMAREGFFSFYSGPQRNFFSKYGPPIGEVAHTCPNDWYNSRKTQDIR